MERRPHTFDLSIRIVLLVVCVFQTFVNDQRIPDQTYVTLQLSDLVRFGYDILLTRIKSSLLTVLQQ